MDVTAVDESRDQQSGADRRRTEARLAVSRVAAELFCSRGLAETSGDDIAAAAGISTRTLWRYFRNKESSVEPLLAEVAGDFFGLLQRWPLELSLEEHIAADQSAHPYSRQQLVDAVQLMRLLTLAESEPTLRTAWLFVCDQSERAFVPLVARRLRLHPDDLEVRLRCAAVCAAFRVVNEDVSVAVIRTGRQYTQQEVLDLLGRAVRDATHGEFGDPVTP